MTKLLQIMDKGHEMHTNIDQHHGAKAFDTSSVTSSNALS